jgi:hypothetical protein
VIFANIGTKAKIDDNVQFWQRKKARPPRRFLNDSLEVVTQAERDRQEAEFDEGRNSEREGPRNLPFVAWVVEFDLAEI